MSEITTSAPNREIEEIMEEEKFGAFIVKHKKTLILSLSVLVGIVLAFGIYMNYSGKSKAEYDSKIFNFDNEIVKNWQEKEGATSLISGFKKLADDIGNYPGLLSESIKLSDLLAEKNFLKESLEVLEIGLNAAKGDYAKSLILQREVAVFEDLGQFENAISKLEIMNGLKNKLFEGKIYLDLGRMYLRLGQKEKAKASFTFIVEKAKDEIEFVKIAKIELSKM